MIFGQGVTAEKLYKLDKRFVILTPGSRAMRSSPWVKITHRLSSTYIQDMQLYFLSPENTYISTNYNMYPQKTL